MFGWFISPSKSFAEGMEIAFSIGLFLMTLMVVVGLVGEYREGGWWKRNLHVFEMLVVLGVAGEMVTETGAFWYSLRLQAIEESGIVQAQQKANDSAIAAAKLGVTVDDLQGFVRKKENEADSHYNALRTYLGAEEARNAVVVAEMKHDEKTLDKARNDATASVASARRILAEMTSELEAQRKVQAQMKAIVAPRDLSGAQMAKIGAALSQFRGQSWTVTTYWDSKEPLALANKIFAALNAAGWRYDNEGSKGMMLGGIEGVYVYVHPQASLKTKKAAEALISALNAEGIATQLRYQNNPKHPNDKLYINVGSKPLIP